MTIDKQTSASTTDFDLDRYIDAQDAVIRQATHAKLGNYHDEARR